MKTFDIIARNKQLPLLACLSLVLLIGFSSCYSPRYVYSPSTLNIPALHKKGDLRAGGYFATGGGNPPITLDSKREYNSGVDLHSAYAVSGRFAIMINQYNRWERN